MKRQLEAPASQIGPSFPHRATNQPRGSYPHRNHQTALYVYSSRVLGGM